jgi:hypothetical protein
MRQTVYHRGVLKLKKSREMPSKSKQVYFLFLLLGAILLTAQLHCCVELNSRMIDSHVCPICSVAGTAVPTPSLIVEMAPAINRLEVSGVLASVPLVVPRSIAPRAPPAA